MSNKIKQDISIGINLKSLRMKQGFTQDDVATKLQTLGFQNISREIISQMELGKYSVRISVLLALKEMYKATWDDVFEGLTFINNLQQ